MNVALKEFNRIMGSINGAYHDVCVKLAISDSEFDILYILCDLGDGCNQSVFYKNSGLGRSTINSSMKKMEKNGLIRIKPGAGKNTRIFLTEQGKALSAQTVERIIAIENTIYHSWSLEDQRMFVQLNEKYLAEFRRETEKLEADKA